MYKQGGLQTLAGQSTQPHYLGEPKEVLHEQAGVGIINLHHRDLIFMRD